MNEISESELFPREESSRSNSNNPIIYISSTSKPSAASDEIRRFGAQYESDWWELASESLFVESQKGRLWSLLVESHRLVEAEDWSALSVCLSNLEPIEMVGISWSSSDTLFFRREVSDQEQKTADILSQRSGRPVSPEGVLSAGKSLAGRVVLTVISARLKQLLRQSEGLKKKLERIEIESRTGLTCHKCGGIGRVSMNRGYERSEGRIIHLDKPEKCTFCRGSGKLRVHRLFVPRENSTDEVDKKIRALDPSVFLGVHLEG